MSQFAPATLSDLPADVRNLIFALLRPCEIAPLAAVCRRWQATIKSSIEQRYATALKEAHASYVRQFSLINCQKLTSSLVLTECPASPVWPHALQEHSLKHGPWKAEVRVQFYTELRAAVASGSWAHFNQAWLKFQAQPFDRLTTAGFSLALAGLFVWPKLMRLMAAIHKNFLNSAASCAAFAGDVECIELARTLSGSTAGSLGNVDEARVSMALAAGGHTDLLRPRLMPGNVADIGSFAVAAASRGQLAVLTFLLLHARAQERRVYIPWNQIMRAASIAENAEAILRMAVANGAREFEDCLSFARLAGRERNVQLLESLRAK